MEFLQLAWSLFIGTCVQRIFFESFLILLILFLLFNKRYKRIILTEQEKNDLIKDYDPEPLVPPTSDDHPLLVQMNKTVASLFTSLTEIPEFNKIHLKRCENDTQDENSCLNKPNNANNKCCSAFVYRKVGKHIMIKGQECLNMASWNFLGLMGNKSVETAAIKALKYWGVGACSPRGFYGTFEIHLECEERFEKFMNTDMAVLYSHGSPTVSSTIASYSKRCDVIFCDEGASFPIVQGCRTSRSTVYYFRHNDMEHLEQLLIEQQQRDKQNPKKAECTRRYITVEAIYANIGDICPLPEIIKLRNKYKARVILDESISFGVLGKNGRGLTEHFGLSLDAVDVMSASLENSFASVGGISMGKNWILWHQRMGSLGYAFSASQPPLSVASLIQAINLLEQDTCLVEKCQAACTECHEKLTGIDGLVLGGLPLSPIKHLRLTEPSDDRQDDYYKLQKIVDFAQKEGVALTMANYLNNLEHILPEPSIRIAVNGTLLSEEIDRVASVIKQGAREILFARLFFSVPHPPGKHFQQFL